MSSPKLREGSPEGTRKTIDRGMDLWNRWLEYN